MQAIATLQTLKTKSPREALLSQSVFFHCPRSHPRAFQDVRVTLETNLPAIVAVLAEAAETSYLDCSVPLPALVCDLVIPCRICKGKGAGQKDHTP